MEPREQRGQYSPEVRARTVRLVLEHAWEAIVSITAKFGCMAETLRRWVQQAEHERA